MPAQRPIDVGKLPFTIRKELVVLFHYWMQRRLMRHHQPSASERVAEICFQFIGKWARQTCFWIGFGAAVGWGVFNLVRG